MEMTDEYLMTGMAFKRLLKEYAIHGCLAIAYDFDATVHDFHGTGGDFDQVKQLIRDLKEIGCKCYCWTAHPDLVYVMKYLNDNNIPCDGVNCDSYIPLPWASRKPFYSALLDDRAGLRQVYQDLSMLVKAVKGVKSHENREDSRSDSGLSDREQRGEVQSAQGLRGVPGIGSSPESVSPKA